MPSDAHIRHCAMPRGICRLGATRARGTGRVLVWADLAHTQEAIPSAPGIVSTMLRFTTGDILRANTDAIVNTVNCVGAMGRGLALQFKRAYPGNFLAYADACQRHEVQPGHMLVVPTGQLIPPRWVINFPTKRHWRGKSRMEDIEAGLAALVNEIKERDIRSVAIPPIGCGLGGLSWTQVLPLIESAFASVQDNIEVLVYEPMPIRKRP